MDNESAVGGHDPGAENDGTVLEVFGVKLKVNNPRLAEVLSLDAKDALTADLKDLMDPAAARARSAELRQAVPDLLVTPETSRDAHDAEERARFRTRVEHLAEELGFTVEQGGVWTSPVGVTLLVRPIEHDVTYATASDYARKLDVLRVSKGGPDGVGLFITATAPATDIFKVAIRQSHLSGSVRTMTLDALADLAGLTTSGRIDHEDAVAVLAPIASVDVGTVVALISRGHSEPVAEDGGL